MELCRHLLVGRWNRQFLLDSNRCLNLNVFYSFFAVSIDTLCLSLISALFHSLLRGEHPNKPSLNGLLCSAVENTLSFFLSACLLLYNQSAGDWLQHWTMICLCMRAHTAKIPQWGAMTTSLYYCHPGASVSILYVSLLHQQPVSPISDLTQHPHWRDVTGPHLHSGQAAMFGTRFITSPSTMYELQHFILKTCKFYMQQLSAEYRLACNAQEMKSGCMSVSPVFDLLKDKGRKKYEEKLFLF